MNAAAAAKSLQSCLTLCNPIDGSPPGSPIPGILQARTLEWVAISFSNAWKEKLKVKSLSRVWLLVTPWTAAYQWVYKCYNHFRKLPVSFIFQFRNCITLYLSYWLCFITAYLVILITTQHPQLSWAIGIRISPFSAWELNKRSLSLRLYFTPKA